MAETSDSDAFDPLEAYDDLVSAGKAPNPEKFAARYPKLPDLLERIRALEALRAQLDEATRRMSGSERPPDHIGGFRLLEPLGKGGMSVVYLAEPPDGLGRCALKLVRGGSAIAVERFHREAELMRRFSHPGIARLVAFGVEGRLMFLVTELVDGVTLRDILAAGAPLPKATVVTSVPPKVRDAVWIAIQVAEALAYAHRQRVVHRDVKPSNIMVLADGRTKLIDFGVALKARPDGERITRTGVFVGSHDYAAPEQLLGDKQAIGPWTDTYALAATLFEMLTGRTPFPGATFAARVEHAGDKPDEGPRHFNSEVPRQLDKLVLRALAPTAKKRLQSGAELAEALREVL